MLIETLATPWVKARETSSTASSFAAKIPTLTEPSGAGVFNLGKDGALARNGLMALGYGTGADNATFDVKIIGWRSVGLGTELIWIPTVLAGITCTLSAITGVAGGALVAADRVVDTMTLMTALGTANVSVELVSPANDLDPAHAVVDLKGSGKIEVHFDLTGATAANLLLAFL